MQFRHELKQEINRGDLAVMRARLKAVCQADDHSSDGIYLIRSLYFDTPSDRALREKIDGVCNREKFRIRFYNHDTSFIRLEKKVKRNSLGYKESCSLTLDEAKNIISGNVLWMKSDQRQLLRELYTEYSINFLRPKTVVDYTREAFTFPAGNVRITLDYNIRTGLGSTDMFNKDLPTLPVIDDPIIMEVKWDDYLPSIVKNTVSLGNRRAGAFSKYAACRVFD